MPRIRALVVGVNEYEEGRLTYAVPDAKSVASTLTQLGADVLLLTDHEATKSKLRDAVEHLCHFERPPMDPSKNGPELSVNWKYVVGQTYVRQARPEPRVAAQSIEAVPACDDRGLKMYKPPTQSEASVSETRGLKMFKEQPAAASTATSVTSDVRGLPFVVPEAADASDEGGKGDIGLFFFSGHGKENDKQIVLIPSGAPLKAIREQAKSEAAYKSLLKQQCITLNSVLEHMEDAPTLAVRIIILDCCRDGSDGNDVVLPKLGGSPAVIFYATGSGNVARDVGGSPFAAAFVEHLAKCRTLRDLREAIHEAMNVATGGRQLPRVEMNDGFKDLEELVLFEALHPPPRKVDFDITKLKLDSLPTRQDLIDNYDRMLRQDCNAKAEKRMEKVEAFRSVAGGATHATDAPRDRETKDIVPLPLTELAISASDDGLLRVWRLSDGACLVGLGVFRPPEQLMLHGRLQAATHLGNGLVAVGGDDGRVRLWDVYAALAEQAAGRGPGPDGFTSRPEEAPAYRLWRTERTFWSSFLSQPNPIYVTSLAAVGNVSVATGYACGTLRIWRVADGALEREMPGPNGINAQDVVAALAVVPIPRGKWTGPDDAPREVLAGGRHSGQITLWDTATWDVVDVLGHGNNVWVSGLAPLPGGRLVACESSGPGLLRLWDVPSRVCLATVNAVKAHNGGVEAVAALHDGRGLVTSGSGGLIRMWQIREEEQGGDGPAFSIVQVDDAGGRAEMHKSSVTSVVAFRATPGGDTWLLSGSSEEIRVWAAMQTESDSGEVVMAVAPGGSKRVLSLPTARFVRGLMAILPPPAAPSQQAA